MKTVQINIYQSKPIEHLGWQHFDDEPRVQERQQGKNQQSHISAFVAFLTIPSRNYKHQPRYGTRFIEIQSNLRRKKLYRMNQEFNFLGGTFGNTENIKVPIQFKRESQPQHLKRQFFLKHRSIHFHINSIIVI